RALYEDRSRNTQENADFVRDLVRPKPGERWLLVTSAHHMPRAVGVFRKAGFDVVAAPVDFRTPTARRLVVVREWAAGLALLDLAAHEWIGLIAYRLTGRTDALLPAP
ncbi:MAG: YdcF family protein, partial [Methylobacteriaceae bacterium]|nr:YdcF family protein [Methylobacteriaceae bacterium]